MFLMSIIVMIVFSIVLMSVHRFVDSVIVVLIVVCDDYSGGIIVFKTLSYCLLFC